MKKLFATAALATMIAGASAPSQASFITYYTSGYGATYDWFAWSFVVVYDDNGNWQTNCYFTDDPTGVNTFGQFGKMTRFNLDDEKAVLAKINNLHVEVPTNGNWWGASHCAGITLD